jgi:hypothetical protein
MGFCEYTVARLRNLIVSKIKSSFPCAGHGCIRRSGEIAPLILNLAVDGVMWSNTRPGRFNPRESSQVSITCHHAWGPNFSLKFRKENKLLSLLRTEQRFLGRPGEQKDFPLPTGIESVLNMVIKRNIQDMNSVFQPVGFEVIKSILLKYYRHFVGIYIQRNL